MPKTRKPVADYITYQQYRKMLKNEPDPAMKLCYRYIWTFMLRVSEAVGQSIMDVQQIEAYRKRYKAKKAKLKWAGAIPGIRMIDIDAVSPKEAGLSARHTLRVHRKMGKFEILPFNDLQLYNDTLKYAKEHDLDVQPTQRLFPFYRQDVLQAMNKHGLTVGGQTKIHPHALRRGGGVYMRSRGKMDIEHLQAVYSHTNLAQTLAYIGIDKRAAFNKFAQAQRRK